MTGNGTASIRVMGIDPGLNITGYGIIERHRQGTALIDAGVIRLPRAEGNNLPLRLETLFKGIQEVVEEFRPEVVCLEEVYSHADYPQTAVLWVTRVESYAWRCAWRGCRCSPCRPSE